MKRGFFVTLILCVTLAGTALSGCIGQSDSQADNAISLIQKGGSAMVDELEAGTVDAMISWEPWNADSIIGGHGHTLMNSSDVWAHHPCCVLAADDEWYQTTENADEILKRVTLAHVQATAWMNEAMAADSANHSTLIQYAIEFTGRSEAVLEYAFMNIDFDTALDADGITTYAEKLDEYDIFQSEKWATAGHATPADYVTDTLNDTYLAWALAHTDEIPETVALDTPASIRVGYLSADLHQLAVWVALSEGLFEQYNITVEQTKTFANGAYEMDEGFKENTIDVGYLGIAPALIRGINNNDFTNDDAKIHVISGVNYNGSAIVVGDPAIDSIADLAGKSLAYPGKGTVQYFIVLLAADEAGVKVQA